MEVEEFPELLGTHDEEKQTGVWRCACAFCFVVEQKLSDATYRLCPTCGCKLHDFCVSVCMNNGVDQSALCRTCLSRSPRQQEQDLKQSQDPIVDDDSGDVCGGDDSDACGDRESSDFEVEDCEEDNQRCDWLEHSGDHHEIDALINLEEAMEEDIAFAIADGSVVSHGQGKLVFAPKSLTAKDVDNFLVDVETDSDPLGIVINSFDEADTIVEQCKQEGVFVSDNTNQLTKQILEVFFAGSAGDGIAHHRNRINEGLRKASRECLREGELLELFHLRVLLMVYGESPSRFFSNFHNRQNPRYGTYVKKYVPTLTLTRYVHIVNSINRQEDHYLQWVRRLEEMYAIAAHKLFTVPKMVISLDDWKHCVAVKLFAKLGYGITFIDKRGLTPVTHVAVSRTFSLVSAFHTTLAGETVKDIVDRLLNQVDHGTSSPIEESLAMQVSPSCKTVVIDRGYSDTSILALIMDKGHFALATMKEGQHAYRFSEPKDGSKDKSTVLRPDGSEVTALAQGKLTSSTSNSFALSGIAYSNGTQNGHVLLLTNNPAWNRYEYVCVPRRYGHAHEPPPASEAVYSLTETQGDPAWFLLRRGLVTSTVCSALIVAFKSVLVADDESKPLLSFVYKTTPTNHMSLEEEKKTESIHKSIPKDNDVIRAISEEQCGRSAANKRTALKNLLSNDTPSPDELQLDQKKSSSFQKSLKELLQRLSVRTADMPTLAAATKKYLALLRKASNIAKAKAMGNYGHESMEQLVKRVKLLNSNLVPQRVQLLKGVEKRNYLIELIAKLEGRKSDLDVMTEEEEGDNKSRKPVLQRILEKWFLRPPDTSKKMGKKLKRMFARGHVNEERVRAWLTQWFKEHAPKYQVRSITTAGLVANKKFPHLATSVDGLMTVLDTETKETCTWVLEIKTFLANQSGVSAAKLETAKDFIRRWRTTAAAREAYGDRVAVRDFAECSGNVQQEGNTILGNALWEVSYRSQSIHHAAVMEIDKVLFVRAKEDAIEYAVLIDYKEQRAKYTAVMNNLIESKLPWIVVPPYTGDCKLDAEPSDERERRARLPSEKDIERAGIKEWGPCRDYSGFVHAWSLQRKMHYLVRKRGAPLPRLDYARPLQVLAWNRLMWGVDQMTQTINQARQVNTKVNPIDFLSNNWFKTVVYTTWNLQTLLQKQTQAKLREIRAHNEQVLALAEPRRPRVGSPYQSGLKSAGKVVREMRSKRGTFLHYIEEVVLPVLGMLSCFSSESNELNVRDASSSKLVDRQDTADKMLYVRTLSFSHLHAQEAALHNVTTKKYQRDVFVKHSQVLDPLRLGLPDRGLFSVDIHKRVQNPLNQRGNVMKRPCVFCSVKADPVGGKNLPRPLSKQVRAMCAQCEVPLCQGECWRLWHESPDLIAAFCAHVRKTRSENVALPEEGKRPQRLVQPPSPDRQRTPTGSSAIQGQHHRTPPTANLYRVSSLAISPARTGPRSARGMRTLSRRTHKLKKRRKQQRQSPIALTLDLSEADDEDMQRKGPHRSGSKRKSKTTSKEKKNKKKKKSKVIVTRRSGKEEAEEEDNDESESNPESHLKGTA